MESIQGFDFFRLEFDGDGNPLTGPVLDELKTHTTASGATDAIFIAHGFRNSALEASTLYNNFLTTFRPHLSGVLQPQLGSRKFVVAGIFWPSKAFNEVAEMGGSVQSADDETAELEEVKRQLEELKEKDACAKQKPKLEKAIALLDKVKSSTDAQDEFVELVLSLLDESEVDPTEGLERVRAAQGSVLLDKLKFPIIVPDGGPAMDEGGVASVGAGMSFNEDGEAQGLGSIFSSVFGRIGQFLNLTTWYLMKDRSGLVGANGVAQAVRALHLSAPSIRIHLVGHSLGGRLMAACTKSLATPPAVRPDSVTLLEAAFSHYGFSPDNGDKEPGFFREVLSSKVVKGPLVATFSAQDTVVGKAYAITSRLAGDNAQAIGDANDPYGGIGRNGAQRTPESVSELLRATASNPYHFPLQKVVNLDCSGGLIKDHGDVTNSAVTFAFACAVSQT